MKKIIMLLIILTLSINLWQCSNDSTANQTEHVNTAIPVKIKKLEKSDFLEYLEITGTIKARNQAKIIIEEGATLKKIVKDKGSYVSKNDTLAIMENLILASNYKQAVASLNQAKLDFKSKNVLYKKKAISENEYLMSKLSLEQTQAANDLAKARYDKLFIVAPFTGYVNDRLYDLGAYALPMTTMFDFIDNKSVKIIAGVAERFLNDIHVGTQVEITFDAFPDLIISSKVSFVYQSIDPASRTFKIEIEVPNNDYKLISQMIANVKLLRRSFEDQIVISLDVMVNSENGRYVFIEQNEKAIKKFVDIIAIYENSALVNGLQKDQNLIVLGQHDLTDGESLLIVKE